ncbi:ankyrin repeat domain-containing protein [Wolbachia endosymbiont of Rhagoletis cerasi]|uniref:ankyrin repeat domain-containing protein n=1 Tax=Wolbachia endosymbiont of Rhagoletis cerasi TaxID=225363 RepID=UPI001BD246D8|nr:ankyrin repeat domain-containing protein [Wolbachia endosymbiont of Rhagoletis cerasi]MBS9530005.1 ankyrin repeat domain-containing protein [Wolbachia endosymbiont of Rhagoletis cerasi]
MSKISRNKFLWCIVAIVFIVITYYYQKSKAAEDHQKMLEVSAKNCDLDTLKLLIKKSRGDSRVSERALYDAAEKGCLEVVKFLLDEGVDINTSLALLSAADSGQLEVVKLLLERGADPYVRGWKGTTPKTIAMKRSSYSGSKKPYREIIDLLDKAEKSYRAEK